MKKNCLFLLLVILLIGCSKKIPEVPAKVNPNGAVANESTVTTKNIDDYLFREDSQYVDLRPYSWVAKDGHIAGFGFYPFYDFIAHNAKDDRLYTFSNKSIEDGSKLDFGGVGTFKANYEESQTVIQTLFSKEKYIFVVSQSGLEGIYFINLLIQLGYDASLLYNIGGFSISPGFEMTPYISLENPKHLVKGNNSLSYGNETFGGFDKLTPIEE